MQGMHVFFFTENGMGSYGIVLHFDLSKGQVIVKDEQGRGWIGKAEHVFETPMSERECGDFLEYE
ncbi:MAG: hypothetical protein JKX76_03150 [Colwellia sp.]|nr:hypothetical protein [Colwellia sp.]